MRRKIIGNTVGTPISPKKIEDDIKPVKTINGEAPDENGNVNVTGGGGGINQSQLETAVNNALAKAKESGEFDGQDGYTPVKGVDYFDGVDGKDGQDGYTPVKGVDYVDGKDGQDGTSIGIRDIVQSELPGDFSTITFTDGKELQIFNGEDGSQGDRGTGILKVSTTPTSYTTATGGKNPIKRMSLSTIKSESGVSEVLVGDTISHSYNLYHIYYLDSTYAYMDKSSSIRGATGGKGADGYTPVKGVDYFDGVDGYTPVKGVDYFDGVDGKDGQDGYTPVKGVDYFDGKDGKDGTSVTTSQVLSAMSKETWVFTLADGTTVEKDVPLL